MATVYILYSKKLNKFYIGSCEHLNKRIEQHRNKAFGSSFTSKVIDWELFTFFEFLGYKQARKIELHIKKMKNKVYIENLKKCPDIIEKLKIKYS